MNPEKTSLDLKLQRSWIPNGANLTSNFEWNIAGKTYVVVLMQVMEYIHF